MSPLIGEENCESSVSGTIKIVSSNDNHMKYDNSLFIWSGFFLFNSRRRVLYSLFSILGVKLKECYEIKVSYSYLISQSLFLKKSFVYII